MVSVSCKKLLRATVLPGICVALVVCVSLGVFVSVGNAHYRGGSDRRGYFVSAKRGLGVGGWHNRGLNRGRVGEMVEFRGSELQPSYLQPWLRGGGLLGGGEDDVLLVEGGVKGCFAGCFGGMGVRGGEFNGWMKRRWKYLVGGASVLAGVFTVAGVASNWFGGEGDPLGSFGGVDDITSGSASFYGFVNPNNLDGVQYFFQYQKASGGITVSTPATVVGKGNADQRVAVLAEGLEPGTEYWVSLIVERKDSVFNVGQQSFTTYQSPIVTTTTPSFILATSATLDGTIDTKGQSGIRYYFEYGPGTDFDCASEEYVCTTPRAVPSGGVIQAEVTDLEVAGDYNLRLVALTADGALYPGNTIQFTTHHEGALVQLPGTAGCTSSNTAVVAEYGCGEARDIQDMAAAFGFSGDGQSAYVHSVSFVSQWYQPGVVSVFQRDVSSGGLSQLDGVAGCVGWIGYFAGCGFGRGMNGVGDVVVSNDGRNVYIVGNIGSSVGVFSRDVSTGELSQLNGWDGCISSIGGDCAQARGFVGANRMVISPDDKYVYIVSTGLASPSPDSGVSVFSRNASTGVLTQLEGAEGCVNWTGDNECKKGRALSRTYSLSMSPDGTSLYVTARGSSAVAVFSRNEGTGELSQLSGADGCISNSQETIDNEGCRAGRALTNTTGVIVSSDGNSVYTGPAWNSVKGFIAVLSRNPTTGALSQAEGETGCVSWNGSDDGTGKCTQGRGMEGGLRVGINPSGEYVYMGAGSTGTIAVFERDTSSGVLKQLDGKDGCISATNSEECSVDLRAASGIGSISFAPDGQIGYSQSGLDNAVLGFTLAD